MTSKLVTLTALPTAEWRVRLERENAAELWRFKSAHDLSNEALARLFGCSVDSIDRYLDERRPVPGYIVTAIRAGKAAA
jgi:hypothetical protein